MAAKKKHMAVEWGYTTKKTTIHNGFMELFNVWLGLGDSPSFGKVAVGFTVGDGVVFLYSSVIGEMIL